MISTLEKALDPMARSSPTCQRGAVAEHAVALATSVASFALACTLPSSSLSSSLSPSLSAVVMMKSKELKTKIYSHAHSLILSQLLWCAGKSK